LKLRRQNLRATKLVNRKKYLRVFHNLQLDGPVEEGGLIAGCRSAAGTDGGRIPVKFGTACLNCSREIPYSLNAPLNVSSELACGVQQSGHDEHRLRRGFEAVHGDGLRDVPRCRPHARGRPRTHELRIAATSLCRRHGRVEL